MIKSGVCQVKCVSLFLKEKIINHKFSYLRILASKESSIES